MAGTPTIGHARLRVQGELPCLAHSSSFSSFCGHSVSPTSYTAGGLIHILLVIAIIVVLIRVIQGRNPLKG